MSIAMNLDAFIRNDDGFNGLQLACWQEVILSRTYRGKRIFTAPSIDYFIDAQASRSIAVCLWLFLLLYILASGFFGMQDFPSLVPSDVCPPEDRNVGCDTVEV